MSTTPPPPDPPGGFPPPEQQGGGFPPPDQQGGGFPPPEQQGGGFPPAEQQGGGFPPPGPQGGYPPPAPQGPWASDNLPPNPAMAAANLVGQPNSIRTAVRLMWVGAAIAVISALTPLAMAGTIRDRVRDNNPDFTKSQVDSAVAAFTAFSIIIGAIAVALWLWMAYTNGQGRSWARVVATVFGALGIIFGLVGLVIQDATALARVLNVVQLVLAITILVFLWQSSSSAYYEAKSRNW
jgi:hypothetical protein